MGTPGAFVSYNLRTTDLDAAEAFYVGLLGWELQRAGDSRELFAHGQRVGELLALPERARTQGAPAHWLGHIRVDDVEAAARDFAAHGAQPLGPVQQRAHGYRVAVLKDPQGAPFALSSESHGRSSAVAWHELNTTDLEGAWACYSELLGWHRAGTVDLGPQLGAYQLFGWDTEGRSMGGMVGSARLPGVHTHWLFYFTVEDVESAAERVRALGGRVSNGPMLVPGGDRVVVCEDTQGAAFGLRQSATVPG